MRRTVTSLLLLACVGACADSDAAPIAMPPVVVQSALRLPAVVVEGASKKWFLANYAPPRYGEPVPVEITAYCLTRTQTRRGRYVRAGIIATDPRLFPLSPPIPRPLSRR